MDPTRSMGRCDSLLKWKENVKRECGLIFEFWKIRPKGGTVLLWSRHLLLSLFLNGENQVRTKNPNDSSMEKKRYAKTKFLGPGIRLPIRKVLHMRYHPSKPGTRSLLVNWVCGSIWVKNQIVS